MFLTYLVVATGFLTGASGVTLQGAQISVTAPLALGMMNSGSNAATVAGVVNVRITQSMA